MDRTIRVILAAVDSKTHSCSSSSGRVFRRGSGRSLEEQPGPGLSSRWQPFAHGAVAPQDAASSRELQASGLHSYLALGIARATELDYDVFGNWDLYVNQTLPKWQRFS